MTFKDQQLNSMTFQAWKMKFLNSMTFQVFHDLCTNPVFGLLVCEHIATTWKKLNMHKFPLHHLEIFISIT